MKICEKCEAFNSNDKFFCVDCGKTLSEKLSDSVEEKVRTEISDRIEKMYNKKDPLYVSKFDKIMGVIAVIGAVATIIYIIFCLFTNHKSTTLVFYAIIFFVLSALDAFVPQLAWSFEKMRLAFIVNGADDLEPGDLYLLFKRIGIVAFTALGFVMLFTDIFVK